MPSSNRRRWGATSHDSASGSEDVARIRHRQLIPDVSDHSEFPSLSGAPQSQQQNASSQAIWNNSSLRAAPQAPVQRPQTQTQPSSTNPQTIQQPSQTQQQQRNDSHHDPQPSPFPPLGGSMDDYRFEDHGSIGRQSRAPGQQGSGDDFPPLGLGDNDMGQVRRAPIGQSSQFSGLGSITAYGDASSQARSGLLGQVDPQRDSVGPTHQGTRIMSPTDLNHRGKGAFSNKAEYCGHKRSMTNKPRQLRDPLLKPEKKIKMD